MLRRSRLWCNSKKIKESRTDGSWHTAGCQVTLNVVQCVSANSISDYVADVRPTKLGRLDFGVEDFQQLFPFTVCFCIFLVACKTRGDNATDFAIDEKRVYPGPV